MRSREIPHQNARDGEDGWATNACLGEGISVKHTYAMSEKLGFDTLFLTFDAFSAHKTDEIQGKLIEKKTDTLMIVRLHFKMPVNGCLY